MAIPLNKKEKDFMRKILKWDQQKVSLIVIINNLVLIAGMIVTLYVAFKTITNLNNLQSLWLLLPGYVIGILLLSIFIIGDVRVKERRKYAAVMRKILIHSRNNEL